MKKIIATIVAFAPAIAFAQTPITDVNSLASKLTNIGNTAIVILIAFAVIYIIFNVIRFIVKADSVDAAKYRGAALWGVVGLFIILSIWGLVRILTNTFRTDTTTPTTQFPKNPYPPQI